MLVEKWKSRADTMKWERWATGMVYECPECPGAGIRYEDRDKLLDHLRSAHFRDLTDGVHRDAAHYNKVKELLDRGRTNKLPPMYC